jgi:spermidine synthase
VRKPRITILYSIILAGLFLLPLANADVVIHKEKSLYRNIVVKEREGQRCLLFSVKREQRNQTCMDLDRPKRIVFPYVRMTLAGLLVNPAPKRVLMIGLGGGTLSNVLGEIYPDITMDLVEVDQAVVNVAREFFDLKESESVKVHTVDGRVFTRRAALKSVTYDLVILDAFTGEYIPEHLMTLEFLQDIGAVLAPGGVVIANTFATSRLYDYESVTYEAAFSALLNLKMPGTGNRVIIASNRAFPDNKTLVQNATQLTPTLKRYDVNIMRYVANLNREADWARDVPPLTDQFSPANLLRER